MSCREIERLFLEGAPEAESRAHALSCRSCAALAAALRELQNLTAELTLPEWTAPLRASLLSIPRHAITCTMADEWLARSVEGELGVEERKRLEDHTTRCGGCAASAQTLLEMQKLDRPEPAPWMTARIAATLRAQSGTRRERPGFAWLRSPRAAIAFAYAAALVLMLAGFNPADLARKAVPAGLGRGTEAVIAEARTSAADRIGAFEERALRRVSIWRGRAGGYGRAALSRAIQLVMKTEPAPSRSRPRNGEEKGALPRTETAINVAGVKEAPASQEQT